jgi:hypothetical protein
MSIFLTSYQGQQQIHLYASTSCDILALKLTQKFSAQGGQEVKIIQRYSVISDPVSFPAACTEANDLGVILY